MVVAADPLAVAAGLQVLRDGGSAADAVVAVQMVLALVEPQASGLGGGALAVSFVKRTGQVLAWDGRETAPAAAGPDLFLNRDGTPMARRDAALGGRAVGVPGAVRMLEALHRAQGRLAWARLIEPAIRLAEDGFAISPGLAAAIAADAGQLRRQPAARAYFFGPDGSPLPAGALLVNHALGETLRAIAADGADALLRAAVASDIATAVRTDPSPGLMTTDDLAAITAPSAPALCGRYRAMTVCGAGPPSAGGVAVLQILGLLGHFDLGGMAPGDVDVDQLLLESEKLAYADRDMYLADADFGPVPVRGLLDPAYLTGRARLIDLEHANLAPTAGKPDRGDARLAPEPAQPEHGTSEIAVVDDFGNAISVTSSVGDPFGARLLVRGFLLNDALADFAFAPDASGRPVANRVEGGKRPRSAMSPTLVFGPHGGLRIVTGSSGGGRIIGFVAQMLVAMIDFELPPAQAVAAGHVQPMGVVAELEAGTPAAALAEKLRARGQVVSVQAIESGQQAIMVTPAGLLGGTDPRHEGIASSD